MSPRLLAELSHLFSIEAFDRKRHGDHYEAHRLRGIAYELHAKREKALQQERRRFRWP